MPICYVYGGTATTTCEYMWDAASTTAAFNTTAADIGTIFIVVIAAILAAWAGLVGLGFAVRKISKYISGRKF